MDTRWLFAAFNWSRFHELAPRLKALKPEGPLDDIEDVEGAEETLEDLGPDAAPQEVSNALIADLCTEGEGALFESGLPGLISWLRRQPRGEDPADTLAGLISSFPGVDEWFTVETGLVGILSAEDTSELARVVGVFRRAYHPPMPPHGLAAITRHFRTAEPAVEHLEELFDVINEAAAEMLGLAAIRLE